MLLAALWAVVGWLAGGILGVLAVALPASRVRTTAGGRCAKCGAPVGLAALVLAPGPGAGRCPVCQTRLREAWPLVEAATAASFAALAWRFGWGWPLAAYTAFAALLALVAFIDLRHRLILDVLTFPAICLALLLAHFTIGLPRALLGGLAAGGVYLMLYLLAWLLYRHGGALGLGDVKLALLIGLVVGAPAALGAAVYGAIVGAVMALALLAAGRSRTYAMPYGPSLVLGALAAILADPTVWR